MGEVVGPSASTVARELWGRTGSWLRLKEYRGEIPPAPRDWSGRRHYPLEYIERIRPLIERRARQEGPDAA